MTKSKKEQTRFIATVVEQKMDKIQEIAKTLETDGVKIENISAMFGIISGRAKASLQDLKSRYEPLGMVIEPDREVGI